METPFWDLDPAALYAATANGTVLPNQVQWGSLWFDRATNAVSYGQFQVEEANGFKVLRAPYKQAYYTATGVSQARPTTYAMVVAPNDSNTTGQEEWNGALLAYGNTGFDVHDRTGYGDSALRLRDHQGYAWPDPPAPPFTPGRPYVIVAVHTSTSYKVWLNGELVVDAVGGAATLSVARVAAAGDLYRAAVFNRQYSDVEAENLSQELITTYGVSLADPAPVGWDLDPAALAELHSLVDGNAVTGAMGEGERYVFDGPWTYVANAGPGGQPGLRIVGGSGANMEVQPDGGLHRNGPYQVHIVLRVDIEPNTPMSSLGSAEIFYYDEDTSASSKDNVMAAFRFRSPTVWGIQSSYYDGPTSTHVVEDAGARTWAAGSYHLCSLVATESEVQIYLDGQPQSVLPAVPLDGETFGAWLGRRGYLTPDATVTYLRAQMVQGVDPMSDMQSLMSQYGITGARRVALEWQPPAHNGGMPVTGYRLRFPQMVEGGVPTIWEALVPAGEDPGAPVQYGIDLPDPYPAPVQIQALNAQGASLPVELTL